MKEALQDKLKYLRNAGKPRLKRDRGETSDSTEPVAKKIKPEFKQYPQLSAEPPIPPQEDDSSNARNNKLLLSQEMKKTPNQQTISVLMGRTYAFCRCEILRTSIPISGILKLYPSLKRLDQVRINY